MDEMLESLVINGALLFGGAAAALIVLRWLAFRLLPPSLVGPGSVLIGTSPGRLGMLQMHDIRNHPQDTAARGRDDQG